ncbi:MAG: hypothetical protein RLZZ313_1893 [Verrucomicrobiota bacterium]|jgi:hypothetical protein
MAFYDLFPLPFIEANQQKLVILTKRLDGLILPHWLMLH